MTGIRWARPAMTFALVLTCASCARTSDDAAPGARGAEAVKAAEPYVVVATLDTGANPFHPTWSRPGLTAHPSRYIPGYPAEARALELTSGASFVEAIEASLDSLLLLQDKQWPMWVPGTNLIGLWSHDTDQLPVFDYQPILDGTGAQPSHFHGAHASSQIAGAGYGMADEAYLVIMDRTNDGSADVGVYESNADGLRWAADQEWIDIIHTNIQNLLPLAGALPAQAPGFEGYPEAVAYAVGKGKLVVSAGGNWYAEFTETSPHPGPVGVLIAGANDNCSTPAGEMQGYTDFSNPDPHVVMDGLGTLAADDDTLEEDTFSGTSSASPRISGYAARLLLETRRAVGDTRGSREGHLIVLDEGAPQPGSGPLADGRLHAAELHEVIRKTADPNPHASAYDGGANLECIPQPADLPFAFYPKMGYGEVSEHTFADALAVMLGEAPMPDRPAEDAYFGFSEQARKTIWGN